MLEGNGSGNPEYIRHNQKKCTRARMQQKRKQCKQQMQVQRNNVKPKVPKLSLFSIVAAVFSHVMSAIKTVVFLQRPIQPVHPINQYNGPERGKGVVKRVVVGVCNKVMVWGR